MAESMHALAPIARRRPAARKPRVPHPHLAPKPEPAAMTPETEDWTPAAVPMTRPAGRLRRVSGAAGRSDRRTSAERMLKSALGFGLFVNVAALLVPRLLPAGMLASWRYGGDDFLLAAAVLLSGYGLLVAGRLSRRPHPPHGCHPRSCPGDRAPR